MTRATMPSQAWSAVSSDSARWLHDAYTSTVTDRIARFGMHMDQSGFPLGNLDWTCLDAFDDLWFWAQDHLSMFDNPATRFAVNAPAWYPYLPGIDVPDGWPSWSGCPDLSVEAHEFAAGVAALLAQYAIDQWNARWVFVDNRSLLEVPRQFEHPSARFGPVRFSPEATVARSIRDFLRHPLWNRPPPWHQLLSRLQCTSSSWAGVVPEAAEQFHADFVGGHLRRLSEFREWLLLRGCDTTALRFDHVEDIETIWRWAQEHVSFAEQVTLPRTEYRSWFPTLAQNAAPTDGLPRWSEVNLSAETLSFASGLAACATEVALRSWRAEWSIGGRRGESHAINRPHLRIEGPDGSVSWIDVEQSMNRWIADAVVAVKRRVPPRPMWSRVLGGHPTPGQVPLALFGQMYSTPTPPWVGWNARFSDRLLPAPPLPEPAPATMTAPPPVAPEARLIPQPAAVPMAFADSIAQPNALESLDLQIEPDDIQGERFWTVDIADSITSACPRLVERFTSRLNRSRGVATAALLNPSTLTLRMTRFGATDLEDVEALVLKVWRQTRATHREPLPV